jgi:hypothetical protein
LTVTALLLAGLNSRPADDTMGVKVMLSRLPCTKRVWVRVPQPLGSFSTTWSMLVLAPRSTWAHCGKVLPADSQ